MLQYSRYLNKKEVSNPEILQKFTFPIEEDFNLYGEDLLNEKKLLIKNFKFYPSRMVNIYDSVNLMINKYNENRF